MAHGTSANADEGVLREKARRAIQAGELPPRRPDRTFGAPGSNVGCRLCGQPLPRQHMEFQLEYDRPGPEGGFDRVHLHPRCFAAWESELKTVRVVHRTLEQRPAPAEPPPAPALP